MQALLAVLVLFRLLPNGFTHAGLRHHLAPPPGKEPGQMTHRHCATTCGGCACTASSNAPPRTFRYRVTATGLRTSMLLTRAHNRILRAGLAELTDSSPPIPTQLRAADRAYQAAIDTLIDNAGAAA